METFLNRIQGIDMQIIDDYLSMDTRLFMVINILVVVAAFLAGIVYRKNRFFDKRCKCKEPFDINMKFCTHCEKIVQVDYH